MWGSWHCNIPFIHDKCCKIHNELPKSSGGSQYGKAEFISFSAKGNLQSLPPIWEGV